jgi:hypothetical protein
VALIVLPTVIPAVTVSAPDTGVHGAVQPASYTATPAVAMAGVSVFQVIVSFSLTRSLAVERMMSWLTVNVPMATTLPVFTS